MRYGGILIILLCAIQYADAQVGIGTSSPATSAKLEISSTTQGFLPPRMNQSQRTAIGSPAQGLMVYQTDGTEGLYYYSGSAWIYIINSTSGTLPVSSGGTGATSFTSGAILTGSGTSALGSITPAGVTGKAVVSNGSTWAATTLTVEGGGTGRSTLSSNSLLAGNGTSSVNLIPPGVPGSVLASTLVDDVPYWYAASFSNATTGSGTSFSNMQPYQSVGYFISINGTYPSFSGENPLMGEIAIFPYNSAPVGWAYCDGSLLNTSAYPALFSLLGTSFGGNGSTTFGIPDLRGKVIIGSGTSAASGTTFLRGDVGGAQTITLSTANMPAHTHDITFY